MNTEYAREQQLKAISKRWGINLNTNRLTPKTPFEPGSYKKYVKVPPEILLHIVEYLDHVTDVLCLANANIYFFDEIRNKNKNIFSDKILRTNHAFKNLEGLQEQDILPAALCITDEEQLNFEITRDYPITLSITNCTLNTMQVRMICAHFSTILLQNCVIDMENNERNDKPYKASTVFLDNVKVKSIFSEYNRNDAIDGVLNLFDQANTFYVTNMTTEDSHYRRHNDNLDSSEYVLARSLIGKKNIIVTDQKQIKAMHFVMRLYALKQMVMPWNPLYQMVMLWNGPHQMVILGITKWFSFPNVYQNTEVMHIDPLNITTLTKENTSLVLNNVKSLTTRLVVNNCKQYIGLKHMKALFKIFPNLETLTLIDTYDAVDGQYSKGYNTITPISTSLKSIRFLFTKEAEKRKEIRTYCSFYLLRNLFPNIIIEKENISNYRIEGVNNIAAQAPIAYLREYEKKDNEIRNSFRSLAAELVILNSKAIIKGNNDIVSKLAITLNSEFNEVDDTVIKNLTTIRDETYEEMKFLNEVEENINDIYKMISNDSDIILQDYSAYIGDDQVANKFKALIQSFEYQRRYNNIVSSTTLKNIEELFFMMIPKLETYPFGGWNLIHRFNQPESEIEIEIENEIEITDHQEDHNCIDDPSLDINVM
jgi:hypothetical protein